MASPWVPTLPLVAPLVLQPPQALVMELVMAAAVAARVAVGLVKRFTAAGAERAPRQLVATAVVLSRAGVPALLLAVVARLAAAAWAAQEATIAVAPTATVRTMLHRHWLRGRCPPHSWQQLWRHRTLP